METGRQEGECRGCGMDEGMGVGGWGVGGHPGGPQCAAL